MSDTIAAPNPAPKSTAGDPAALPPLPADAVIIVPVRESVLFPEIVLPVNLDGRVAIAGAQQAVRAQRQFAIVLQKDPTAEAPGPAEMHSMGVVANLLRYITTPDGGHHMICQGVQRFHITEFLDGWPFLVARGLHLPEPAGQTAEVEARFVGLKQRALEEVGS